MRVHISHKACRWKQGTDPPAESPRCPEDSPSEWLLFRGAWAGTAPGPLRAHHAWRPGPPRSTRFVQEALFCLCHPVRGTHGLEASRGLSDKAGGGSSSDYISLIPLLAGWASLRGRRSFPAVWPLQGLSTLPWGLRDGVNKDSRQDWMTSQSGQGNSPWAKAGWPGGRNRLAPCIM